MTGYSRSKAVCHLRSDGGGGQAPLLLSLHRPNIARRGEVPALTLVRRGEGGSGGGKRRKIGRRGEEVDEVEEEEKEGGKTEAEKEWKWKRRRKRGEDV